MSPFHPLFISEKLKVDFFSPLVFTGWFGGVSLFLAPVVLVSAKKAVDMELLKISQPKILHLHKLLTGP